MLLVLTGGLASCNKNNEEILYGCIGGWCLEVENGSEFTDVVELKLMASDARVAHNLTTIANSCLKNGRFNIALPETLVQDYLFPLVDGNQWLSPQAYIYVPSDRVTISNEDVNIGLLKIAAFNEKSRKFGDSREIGVFFPVRNEEGISITGSLVYADSDVTISGHDRFVGRGLSPLVIPPESSRIYSIELKKGWNVLYILRQGDAAVLRAQCLATFMNGANWRGGRHQFQTD